MQQRRGDLRTIRRMTSPRSLVASSLVGLVAVLATATVAAGAATRKPNLAVPQTVVPAHLEVGSTKTINVTVKNSGAVAAALTTVKLTLSTTRSAGRTSLGSARVNSLASGRSAVVPVTVTVPESSAMGDTYVVACVDPGARVVESSETDNCRAASTHVM
jgi:uncharacterized membrane protein